MKLAHVFVVIFCLNCFVSHAQLSKESADSLKPLTALDHQKMMSALNISTLRPGPSGNPNAANAANTNESLASTYVQLPDALILKNGRTVKDSNTWFKNRRREIMEDFDREVYGRVPKKTPKVKWKLVSETRLLIGSIPVITKELIGEVDNSIYPAIKVEIKFSLTVPEGAKSVPVMIEFGVNWPQNQNRPNGGNITPDWKQQLIEKGWGYAILSPNSIQADHGAGLTQGIIGLCNKGNLRKSDDWGALRAWAWGASRALDYLETDPTVNAKMIGIEGVSRYGKAALVTMAYDERFAIGFIASSGQGGAKIMRRTFGEQVENVASSGEYHWMAGNYLKYAGPLTPNDLPVDAHELIALCAPRPLFISVGSPTVEGQWVDAKGMFLAAAHAGNVYKLLGKKDLGTMEFPPIETFLKGDIAFRQHSGGHTAGPNWSYFIQFAVPYFSK
jgi:hypothetical protein